MCVCVCIYVPCFSLFSSLSLHFLLHSFDCLTSSFSFILFVSNPVDRTLYWAVCLNFTGTPPHNTTCLRRALLICSNFLCLYQVRINVATFAFTFLSSYISVLFHTLYTHNTTHLTSIRIDVIFWWDIPVVFDIYIYRAFHNIHRDYKNLL